MNEISGRFKNINGFGVYWPDEKKIMFNTNHFAKHLEKYGFAPPDPRKMSAFVEGLYAHLNLVSHPLKEIDPLILAIFTQDYFYWLKIGEEEPDSMTNVQPKKAKLSKNKPETREESLREIQAKNSRMYQQMRELVGNIAGPTFLAGGNSQRKVSYVVGFTKPEAERNDPVQQDQASTSSLSSIVCNRVMDVDNDL